MRSRLLDESIDPTVISTLLEGTAATAAVHRMTACVDDLFEVRESLRPLTPNDIWAKYYRPPLERDGLILEIDGETSVIPESETLDAFVAVNQQSIPLAAKDVKLVDTQSYDSKQEACATIRNCTGWWRFSRIGYNHNKTEALVHADYDHPRHGLMGFGHFVLLRRDSDSWLVIAKHMTWIS